MNRINRFFRSLSVFILIAFSWFIVYINSGTVYSHLFYFPIFLAARFWRIKGGVIIGLLAGILCGPFTPLSVAEQISQPIDMWMIRGAFFISFGLLAGFIFTILEKKQNEIVLQSKALQEKNKEIKEMKDTIQNASTEIIQALAHAVDVRDEYTSGHCFRVSEMAYQIGKQLGLNQEELLYLKWSGILHDIGKLGIPEEIINKPGKLTPEEYDMIKQHTAMGLKILSGITPAPHIVEGIYYHHERMDGSGYPDGVAGKHIPLQARIIAVSDVWDALTSKRSYRDSLSKEEALAIMEKGRGNQFDPLILDIFMKIIENQSTDKREVHNEKKNL